MCEKSNLAEKTTQNLRVNLIFDGLKTSCHIVSHKPCELMFWLLTAVKSNCIYEDLISDSWQMPIQTQVNMAIWIDEFMSVCKTFQSLEMECLW